MSHCSNFINRGGSGMMGGGMFGMGFLWWIVIGLAIVGVVYILRNNTTQQGIGNNSPEQNTDQLPSAMEILDQEFAKGNLTEEEYLNKKELLIK